MYSVGIKAVAGPPPCKPHGILPRATQIESLRAFAGKAFTTFEAGFAATFTSFPNIIFLPAFCGLVLQLQRRELRDHELLGLLHLCAGDGLQGGEDTLHVLRLELRRLSNLLRQLAAPM